jgi:hypothetical protein
MARLELEIDVEEDDHVYGTVRTEDGADASFVGWIGLMALLQQALT